MPDIKVRKGQTGWAWVCLRRHGFLEGLLPIVKPVQGASGYVSQESAMRAACNHARVRHTRVPNLLFQNLPAGHDAP